MPPDLSVIIASYNSRRTIGRCLDSLRAQETGRTFEVIVVDSSTDGAAQLIAQDHPEVVLITSAERRFPGGARNIGVSAATAGIIALLDADCTVDPGWVDAVLDAHRSPDAAVGGAIANGDRRGRVARAAYFTEFSQWMPGERPGWMADAAAANMSYKRDVLDDVGPFIEGSYCSDTDFHWRMRRKGHRLRFEPAIVAYHHSINELGAFLRHERAHGCFFARVRSAGQGFSAARRLAYAALCWFIPFVLFARLARRHLRNRVYLADFLMSSPLVLLGLAAWALGEGAGYLKGSRIEGELQRDVSPRERRRGRGSTSRPPS